ncbi:MAG: PilW family protein [Planctomycetota bacterium]
MQLHPSRKWPDGLTLIESVLALAIVVIVMAAVLPQVRLIQNSWDCKQAAAETLQNGRVLIGHLRRKLSTARRITAVSDAAQSSGYIAFEDNDANSYRYDISGTTDYVRFGPIGNPADLAGPVSRLQLTCYGAYDLDTPTTDVNSIRCVKVQTTLTNSARLDQDMTFSTVVYIRTNALPVVGGLSKLSEPWLEFDPVTGMEPALAHIGGTRYLCAYRGDRDDGFAQILTVNPADWTVSPGDPYEYNTKSGITPALAKIQDNYALCAYQGDQGDGWACVLYESAPGVIAKGPPLEFDTADCVHPALSQIDTSHYLCAYFDNASAVRVLVLTVDTGSWSVSNGPTMSFGCDLVCNPDLVRTDDTHHVCAYRGSNLRLWAVVLTVNPADWTVTAETPFEVAPSLHAYDPALAQIDQTHYLYALNTNTGYACAAVVTVNTTDWTITKDTAYDYYQFSDAAASVKLCQIDAAKFLCAYAQGSSSGLGTVLTVDSSDWSMSHGTPLTFESGACAEPALCRIDASHYLCGHAGLQDHGFAGVLELTSPIRP